MGANTSAINLLGIVNWGEIAANVQYQAPLLAQYLKMHPRRLQRVFQKQL